MNEQFDRTTHGLFAKLYQVVLEAKTLETEKMEAEKNSEGDELEEENLLNDDDYDVPMVAFNRIVDSFEIPEEAAPQFRALRRIVSHLETLADNYHEVAHELRELQAIQPADCVRQLSRQVETLSESLEQNRNQTSRLEGLLMSIAGKLPYSEVLLDEIFLCLNFETDKDLKNRLVRQMIEARPLNVQVPPPQSPDLNQDDSVRGVYQRGHIRTGKNVPNSA